MISPSRNILPSRDYIQQSTVGKIEKWCQISQQPMEDGAQQHTNGTTSGPTSVISVSGAPEKLMNDSPLAKPVLSNQQLSHACGNEPSNSNSSRSLVLVQLIVSDYVLEAGCHLQDFTSRIMMQFTASPFTFDLASEGITVLGTNLDHLCGWCHHPYALV